jgi:hypothetical protein
MCFEMKIILKNNYYHTSKHPKKKKVDERQFLYFSCESQNQRLNIIKIICISKNM